MTRIPLAPREERAELVVLGARAAFPGGPVALRYPTRTGALLLVDGVAAGAFDARHPEIALEVAAGERDVALLVERRALPVDGLPAGDGVRWRWMVARAGQTPGRVLELRPAPAAPPPAAEALDVPMVGHAHLDVAWLWTYDDARRKAARTFATALRQMARDPRYVFAQSQPQLYAWVAADRPELIAAIRVRLDAGWDASVATMWVEPDLHVPSGESILRQFAHGIGWCARELGVTPTVAWLPDTFGFPATFPTLAVHAGVPYFATTKLEWNETTRWPYPRFRWEGDDGSALVAAVIHKYDGTPSPSRKRIARARREPVVHGYGDGGGGPADADLAAQPGRPWTTVARWFAEDVAADAALPAHRGELYLETHRGTYTTQRRLKARLAALERALDAAEEAAAWVVAVGAPAGVRRPLVDDLRTAWQIVLRAQFHDVAAGTSIAEVYERVDVDLERAERAVARVAASAASVLPRAALVAAPVEEVAPRRDGDRWRLENDWLRAVVRDDGTVAELAARDGRGLVVDANRLACYVDRPTRWDAWNLDAGYDRRPLPVRGEGGTADDGGVVARLRIGRRSTASLRVSLRRDEPWLRVDAAVDWREDHAILRVEHRLATAADAVRFGQPHGTLLRSARAATPAERARFEVPAQRWAHVADPGGDDGLAVLVPDLYGWSARALDAGGLRLGTSLLRAPRWPDPGTDRGEQQLAWALAPTRGAAISGLEHAWRAYALEDRVRLVESDDDAVLVVATYPSKDGEAVIVRVRECDGAARTARLRLGARVRRAVPVDAVGRPVAGDAELADETLSFALGAFALRAFRLDVR